MWPCPATCWLSRWGRLAAADPQACQQLLASEASPATAQADNLDTLLARGVAHLSAYQNAAWAARYSAVVQRVADTERQLGGDASLLARACPQPAAADGYKDEYEVARPVHRRAVPPGPAAAV